MRVSALFLILNIQLGHISAAHPNQLELSAQTNRDQKGYECGNIFFTDLEVNEALSLALSFVDKGFNYPERYQGKLYSESNLKEYFLWPIRKGSRTLPDTNYPMTNFRVVLTRDSSEAVDMIAMTTTNDYTKCIRRHNSLMGPFHSESENSNGYLCGHRFFADETVQQSLALALTRVEDKTQFPSPYIGLIYPKNSGYLMWPILRGKMLYISGTVYGPYFLILDKESKIVDVVVRGFSNNFLRCIRSRKPPKAPESDPHSKLFVPPPKTGFLCGKTFFDDKILEEAANTAKTQVSNGVQGQFPKEYSSSPYNEKCLIWPIMKDGKLYRKGNKGPYRFLLTLEYKAMSVAVLFGDKLKACEIVTIKAKKTHDKSGYLCDKRRFSHQELVEAAEKACGGIKTPTKHFYPASYEGPKFNSDRPYFTYPLDKYFVSTQRNVSPDRVVINANCEVVGALTTVKTATSRFQKRLVKCHRLENGPLPIGFFGANAVTVHESRIDY
ncbi:hypothetical protein EPUL_004402 [Erysiphe pulchra]|uniref:Uncharacterized protein n=1 Tax=Erysiphe pulchra TaxID=225359 RepID=A0A2S4PLA1_9PEZI|nr:hypothetical protein EPUL_004402 [Erysiphe pulchra]